MLSKQEIKKSIRLAMKQQTKIELPFLRERLQNRMNYRNPEYAFNVLLYGWCKKKKHSTNWLSDVRRRGWLSLPMARDFANYCGYMFI